MYSRITKSFPSEVLRIYNLLYCKNKSVYFVGGCVRDALLGKKTCDFDITCALLPQEIFSLLEDFGFFPFMKNARFGTVSVNVRHENELCSVEITPFRCEGDYRDFRHPEEVRFSKSIYEDISRRDFTVNAIAVSKNDFVDCGGTKDLENKLLRCVGKPEERFRQDALRVLRALRFLAKLGFTAEKETEDALYSCYPLLKNISRERILEETEKILAGPLSKEVLQKYEAIFSFFLGNYSVKENFEKLPEDFILRYFSLVRTQSKEEICNRFCFSRAQKERLYKLCGLFCESGGFLAQSMGEREIKLLIKYGKDTLLDMFSLLDLEKGELESFLKCGTYRLRDLAVSGEDLKSAKIFGADISKTLNILLENVALGKLKNEKDMLLRYTLENLR